MTDATQQHCRHFRIAEHQPPLAEGEIGRDNQRGLFIELADQIKQQGAAGRTKHLSEKTAYRGGSTTRLLAPDKVLPLRPDGWLVPVSG